MRRGVDGCTDVEERSMRHGGGWGRGADVFALCMDNRGNFRREGKGDICQARCDSQGWSEMGVYGWVWMRVGVLRMQEYGVMGS